MAQLQKPPFVFMDGRLTAWEDARIHVGSEALIRGISVFEGIKGYWSHDNSVFGLLALREHYDRLKRSAALQYLPFEQSYDEYRENCSTLVRKLLTKERDLWARTTLFSIDGQWGEFTHTDLVITAYHQDKKRSDPIDMGVSTWQRPSDSALPARIKSAANYQISRLARIEGRRQNCTDMILLNAQGRVAEASASCVLIARGGKVSTPPSHEGCLESITVNIVEALCATLGIPFERRPIDRTELAVADEICLAGTLVELGRVRRFESRVMPAPAPIFDRIEEEFWACMRGKKQHSAVHLTPV